MTLSEAEAQVRKTFDTVANGYDHPSLFWFDLAADALIREAAVDGALQVLDVATGTGKVALALAAIEPRAHVTGIDLSDGMLAQARRKAAAQGLLNTEFIQMSFDELSFGERFDLLTCSFGIFFVEAMSTTLRRFAAQLKPGGRIVLTSFGLGSFSPFSEAFTSLYREFGFEAPPPRWLRLTTTSQLNALFAEAGLPAPQVVELDFGRELRDERAWWDIVYNAGYRGMLDRMSDERAASFKERHLAEVRQLMVTEGQKRLSVQVVISSCQKP